MQITLINHTTETGPAVVRLVTAGVVLYATGKDVSSDPTVATKRSSVSLPGGVGRLLLEAADGDRLEILDYNEGGVYPAPAPLASPPQGAALSDEDLLNLRDQVEALQNIATSQRVALEDRLAEINELEGRVQSALATATMHMQEATTLREQLAASPQASVTDGWTSLGGGVDGYDLGGRCGVMLRCEGTATFLPGVTIKDGRIWR